MPVPTSTNRAAPSACIRSTDCAQRTGAVSWSSSRRRISSGSVVGDAVTFSTTGHDGVVISSAASVSASPSRANAISGLWKAPLTGKGTTRRAPASVASTPARPTASPSPEITIWPGSL